MRRRRSIHDDLQRQVRRQSNSRLAAAAGMFQGGARPTVGYVMCKESRYSSRVRRFACETGYHPSAEGVKQKSASCPGNNANTPDFRTLKGPFSGLSIRLLQSRTPATNLNNGSDTICLKADHHEIVALSPKQLLDTFDTTSKTSERMTIPRHIHHTDGTI